MGAPVLASFGGIAVLISTLSKGFVAPLLRLEKQFLMVVETTYWMGLAPKQTGFAFPGCFYA